MTQFKLSPKEASDLVRRCPHVPAEYVSYLVDHGWGETPSGKTLYSGAEKAEDIYGFPVGPTGLLILGDDCSGYCFGYDPSTDLYGEVDPKGVWEPWQRGKRFAVYVAAWSKV